MAQITQISNPRTQKLFFYMGLVELIPISNKLTQIEAQYKKLDAKEKDGTLYSNEEELNLYIALQEQKEALNQQCDEWWQNSVTGMGYDDEAFEQQIEQFKSNNRKKNKKQETEAELTRQEKIRIWGSYVGAHLWGENQNIGELYINQLSEYITAPDKLKEKWVDEIVIEKVKNINQNLPRNKEYMTPQAELLEKIQFRMEKSPNYDDMLEKYFADAMLEKASTFGPDNQMMRCISNGRFFLPDDKRAVKHSEYFKKHYGKKFNLPPEIMNSKTQVDNCFNGEDFIEMIEQVYSPQLADYMKKEMSSKGISEYELKALNGYDIAKIMQDKNQMLNATNIGRKFSQIWKDCPESPYQKQARRIGFMQAIGKSVFENFSKDKNISRAVNETAKNMELKIIKSGPNKSSSYNRIYKELFQEDYADTKTFLTDCLSSYRSISIDFQKAGMDEYYNRWVDAMCQKGEYNLKANDIPHPFEITFHHKVPVKLAHNLNKFSKKLSGWKKYFGCNSIHSGKNFLLAIEFKAPEKGKLTKHMQEHQKESGSLATLESTPDSRYYISSNNTTLSQTGYNEPAEFTLLREGKTETILTPNLEPTRAYA